MKGQDFGASRGFSDFADFAKTYIVSSGPSSLTLV